jgi:hypothetical protein
VAFLPVVPVAFDGTKRTGSPAWNTDAIRRLWERGTKNASCVLGGGAWDWFVDRIGATLSYKLRGNTLIANTLVRRYFLRHITGVVMALFQMPRFRSDVIDDVFHSEVFAAEVLMPQGDTSARSASGTNTRG